ncbi:MAG: DUF1127 domain-containing protein [Rhizobiaceae bacterium]
MTTIDACETRKTATGWTAIAATAAAAVEKAGNLYRAWQNRRELYRLSDMSDRELQDIGLSRSDLFIARDVPASIDPTARLGALADRNCRKI